MKEKELYVAPGSEVLELCLEGNVLETVSGTFGDNGLEGGWN